MMEGWRKIKLEEISKIYSGYAFKSNDMTSDYNLGIPLIKIKNIHDRIVDSNYDSYLLFNTVNEKHHKYKLLDGDVLVAMTGQGSVGRIGKKFDVDKIYYINQRVGIIRVNEVFADKEFIYQQIATNHTESVYFNLAMGAGQPNLSPKDIGNLFVLLPPIQTQQKIASILSAYDDLIENNLKRIKLLEEMAQQTYEEWFVRMRFPGYETAVMNEETGLPEGWERVKLKDICALVMGQSPKSEDYNIDGNGLPFHQGVKDYGFRFPTNKSWSISGNKKASPNSILFSVRAPVGRLNVASEEIILGRGLAAINDKNGLNSFLYYQLRKIFFEDNLIGGGAIYASVTRNDVERIELIYVDRLSKIFNDYASKIDEQILNLTHQNQRLKEARDILLPRLMSGMIEV